MAVHLAFGRPSDQDMVEDVHLRIQSRLPFELGLDALPLGKGIHDEAGLHDADGDHQEAARILSETLAVFRRHRDTPPVVQRKWMFPSEHSRPNKDPPRPIWTHLTHYVDPFLPLSTRERLRLSPNSGAYSTSVSAADGEDLSDAPVSSHLTTRGESGYRQSVADIYHIVVGVI